MDKIKFSGDILEQIKDFKRQYLTEEQESSIDKPISNKEEVKPCYKKNDLCNKCNRPKRSFFGCNYCYFQQNFKNWNSGNQEVNELIHKVQLKAENWKEVLEWIEYDRFENIEYMATGGFGIVFKAIWKDGYMCNDSVRVGETEVALKCLHYSQNITAQFLKEVELNISVKSLFSCVVRCFGITKDPETNNFMMVMELKKGSLRQHLNNHCISLNWKQKLRNLQGIALGLKYIHDSGLIHRDLHVGNILSNFNDLAYITDLGLCQPANINTSHDNNKEIYGVLPYIAPEVLRGEEYTQASDIYGFGIIAYEICTGLPPYHDISHDEFLAMKICQGLRPKCNYKIPQLIFDMINQCWDANPLKRPKANELSDSLNDLYRVTRNELNRTIYNQIKEVNEINENSSYLSSSSSFLSSGSLSFITHPQAIYTSRLLDFKNLPEPKNADDDSLEFLRIDFTKPNHADYKGY
ncbi:hypothetical protein RclHR1_00140009 [Rhizophagus clarus]|uniref:Kinase-like domain-containing protein n=1 Tax=Rhizophagus clarus TaxID=94130 RepID=A0A2Z6QD96_9GLOM|nr:hypothetical protein RclHR1_00140009 [Rhizophagus clarus]GES77254.1 kinase-like domain-containing protein [Rhizophagus clarus]